MKAEVLHTTHYASVLNVLQFMHYDKLRRKCEIHQPADHARIFGCSIEKQQLNSLSLSPFFSITIDESTDVSVLNDVYARYITSDADVRTSFLTITPLFSDTAAGDN